ncbi:hypothetical protein J3Q64DRAFT_1826527 [Phycomyces blakesleeanus]|uniref:Velvet domain-containing protein n=2 Tax=Phycomyces blakesleeanus TaxID=4837 RepID=A0A167LFG9_PHYB8|nr:hypothetical protein PHYBLDRAFT_171721 [Phycomyces blakesleeanus NRRL 1555(-)]OAD70337.1 hypothetical protein PHYBLDRAFT_171721 [Phycomyces blakesleeanus NRRL 1555(-)]|eukprot:XP_018288377.1 hypothetical protein PHYBLDRAFT_171721 [Phycomyces blakesleeanus NRRL 1555(-)]
MLNDHYNRVFLLFYIFSPLFRIDKQQDMCNDGLVVLKIKKRKAGVFSLLIRQQPSIACLTKPYKRDRRMIEPPPIIQIKLKEQITNDKPYFLESPYLFIHVSLVADESNSQETIDYKNILQGQTSSSMYQLKDIDNKYGGFCIFSNLFVKETGSFRLKFSLFWITSTEAVHMCHTTSDIFTVYSVSTYPGSLESTFLSRAFSSQGIRIATRKQSHAQINSTCKRRAPEKYCAIEISDRDNVTKATCASGLPILITPEHCMYTSREEIAAHKKHNGKVCRPNTIPSCDISWSEYSFDDKPREAKKAKIQKALPVSSLPPIRDLEAFQHNVSEPPIAYGSEICNEKKKFFLHQSKHQETDFDRHITPSITHVPYRSYIYNTSREESRAYKSADCTKHQNIHLPPLWSIMRHISLSQNMSDSAFEDSRYIPATMQTKNHLA